MTEVEKFLPPKIFDLYYSMPGEGKSEAIKAVAKQALKENPGKIVKLVIGDGSAGTYTALINAGKARVIEVNHRPWPTDTINRLTSGWDLKDPLDPTSPLVAPTPELLNSYCFTAWEGASVFGKYIMGSVKGGMAYRSANGEQLGPDATIAIREGEYNKEGKLIDGPGTAFGTNGTAHYMHSQGNLVEFVNRSRALPGHHVWTAHETVVDEVVNIGDLKNPVKVRKGMVLGGPEVSGKALAPLFQKAFNNALHFQTLQKQVKEQNDELGQMMLDNDIRYLLWTRDHFAQQAGVGSIKYKGCTRNVGEKFPAFFEGEKRGENIINYYKGLYAEVLKEMEDL